MENKGLIRNESNLIKWVGNAINITNKLLAIYEPVLIPYRKKNKWGFCTAEKKIIIDCIYDGVGRFYGGMAVFELNRKWGYIDKKGRMVVLNHYDHARNFSEGLARVELNRKYGFVNHQGVEVIPCIYDSVYDFWDIVTHVRLNNKHGLIDKTGKEIIPIVYSSKDEAYDRYYELNNQIVSNISNDRFNQFKIVEKNGKYGINDNSGKLIVPCIYDSIDQRGFFFSEGLIDVESETFWGYVNEKGEQVIPCIYDDAYPFFEGLAGVLLDEFWGFIDQKGNAVIPFKYEHIGQVFNDGLALVNNQKFKEGYINKEGIEFWED